ncbi:MAG: Ig-like domain-containing protein [Eubacteriales bacterium]|nr:Ig-like domain-containing protein [Eubacteriales bacterium]
MKKKIATIVCLVLVMIMALPVFSFAAGSNDFRIVRTTPTDGAKNTTKDNMCVKIFFNQNVGSAKSVKANAKKIRIVNESGKEIPTRVYCNSKTDPKYVLIIVDTNKIGTKTIKDNTEYTCIVDKSFRDDNGDTLGTTQRISFRTMNQGRNTAIYMVMMVLMMVAMFAFSAKSAIGRELNGEEAEEVAEARASFNPYREAKKTGKSVEEVLKEHEKELAKEEKKKKKHANVPKEERGDAKRDGNAYCVKQRAPISKAGSTYKTGRKAKAEAEARRKAEEKARRKATNYGKNPQPKKKR